MLRITLNLMAKKESVTWGAGGKVTIVTEATHRQHKVLMSTRACSE